jgi:methylamine---glutamate N-methyltransferase subunit A
MCGVIGLLLRDPSLEPELGSMLVPMLDALDERGPDSSGIAVYADPPTGDDPFAAAPTLRMSLGADVPVDWVALGCALLDLCPSGADVRRFGAGTVVDVPGSALERVEAVLAEQWPDVRVLGTGWNLRVLKDTGRPSATCARYGVRDWEGYLAIAHTRMATESAVTLLHSHPFVPDRDLCVVHNGSFSNYATVRRRLEDEGITFDSDNDSEVGARFLARRLAFGDDLEEATRWVMKEMDGFFTLVITSADGMSVVRDAFA